MTEPKGSEQTASIAVTAEQRYCLINDVAYFRKLKHQRESGKDEV